MNMKFFGYLLLLIVTFFIPQESRAIAPVLIPVFASALEILGGILLLITAPAIIIAAGMSFFGLKINKNRHGKIKVHFNWKIFLINGGMLLFYMGGIVLITFLVLQYKYGMRFIVGEQIQERILAEAIGNSSQIIPSFTRGSWGALIGSFWMLGFLIALFLSFLAEAVRYLIFRSKIYFNLSIIFSDIVWLTSFTFMIIISVVTVIYFYFQPYFIL